MSDGDDEDVTEETPTGEEATEATDEETSDESDGADAPTVEELNERLDAAEADLESAETESDLDAVDAAIDDVEADVESADLPEPDEDEEDAENPREELESRISGLREDVEAERGPYAEDVVDDVEAAKTKISETRWTDRGEREVAEAVTSFTDRVGDILEESFPVSADADEAALNAALDDVVEAVKAASLDPDDDAETIADLTEATDELESDLEAAQEWDDLETREQLEAEGFFDVLGHYKDFPPEWSALKEWEHRGNVEMVLLALDNFGSDFMERHCLEALTRMNDAGAYDAMAQRASKRDKPGIKVLGKMGEGAADAVETLVEYVDTDSDPALQKATFKALGEIGDEAATQPIANKLRMDNDNVRPYAARALGLIGDTRAIDPLTDSLQNDEDDSVRTAAAWALRQIGTREALEAAAEHTDDRSFLVQNEAERARDALGVEKPA